MSPTNLIFAALSVALGAGTFVKTQAVTKDFFEPVLAACLSKNYTSVDDFCLQTGYHAYNPSVGFVLLDPFVCAITQFLYTLAESYPAGLLTWGAITLVGLPVTVLTTLEAGRQGNRGLLRYPTLVGLLQQVLGISVVIPLLWVPAYCWGASNPQGSVALTRARASFPLALTFVIAFLLIFVLLEDTQSYGWTLCAGILGGPVISLPALLLWFVGPPPVDTTTQQDALRSAEAAALSYGLAGLVALLGWFYLMYVVLTTYGTDTETLWKDVWAETTGVVQFATIDAVVLWVALVLHIGSRSLRSCGEAILFTPFFGPGAACAMALASLELNEAPVPTTIADSRSSEQKKKTS